MHNNTKNTNGRKRHRTSPIGSFRTRATKQITTDLVRALRQSAKAPGLAMQAKVTASTKQKLERAVSEALFGY